MLVAYFVKTYGDHFFLILKLKTLLEHVSFRNSFFQVI